MEHYVPISFLPYRYDITAVDFSSSGNTVRDCWHHPRAVLWRRYLLNRPVADAVAVVDCCG